MSQQQKANNERGAHIPLDGPEWCSRGSEVPPVGHFSQLCCGFLFPCFCPPPFITLSFWSILQSRDLPDNDEPAVLRGLTSPRRGSVPASSPDIKLDSFKERHDTIPPLFSTTPVMTSLFLRRAELTRTSEDLNSRCFYWSLSFFMSGGLDPPPTALNYSCLLSEATTINISRFWLQFFHPATIKGGRFGLICGRNVVFFLFCFYWWSSLNKCHPNLLMFFSSRFLLPLELWALVQTHTEQSNYGGIISAWLRYSFSLHSSFPLYIPISFLLFPSQAFTRALLHPVLSPLFSPFSSFSTPFAFTLQRQTRRLATFLLFLLIPLKSLFSFYYV